MRAAGEIKRWPLHTRTHTSKWPRAEDVDWRPSDLTQLDNDVHKKSRKILTQQSTSPIPGTSSPARNGKGREIRDDGCCETAD